ncbi:lipopolysaccharide biosynthesis protein [Holdemania massiliensis]|uniref:lipopolysaccharide biosynthesis protein n=1 Tax=Holdemania massiliensis TaxID=1468449 RepID=UPI001F057BA9|nr:lipopolysaccharide biosynthesis protein [Holdemania massiliensis]MCH1940708.1 lipopolysaccharide biosynthesis protein [Holdemania massiliensis]
MSSKKGILSGLVWSFGERISAQLVSTVVSIVLARLLTPEHYGVVSIVMVFITFCNVFVTSGFGNAVVQKKEVDTVDFSTAFWLSFSTAAVLYVLLFAASPFIAKFYGLLELKWIIRVMGFRLLLASMNDIQRAYMRRNMQFKKFFIATLGGTILSGFVGIMMAYNGFGAWSIVAQYLTNTFVDTAILCIVSGWNPKFQFSIKKAKEIFSFGGKVLAAQLVSTTEGEIRALIIGKAFGMADLAFYDQGKKYPALLVNNVNSSLISVMLPVFSRSQDNLQSLKAMLRKTISTGMFLLVPLMFGLSAVSNTFVSVLMTDKWIPAVPYIKIFCFVFLLRPFEIACNQAVLAIGKSDISFKVMLAVNLTALATLMIAVFGFNSVLLVAIGSLLSSLVSVICFLIVVNRHITYTAKDIFHDIWKPIVAGALMSVAVNLLGVLAINKVVLLISQIAIGGIVYIISSYLLKIEAMRYAIIKMEAVIK